MLPKSSKNILLQNFTKYKIWIFYNLSIFWKRECLISYFVGFQFCGWTNLINLISPSQQSGDFLFLQHKYFKEKVFTKPMFPSSQYSVVELQQVSDNRTKSLFVWKVQTSFLSDSPPWSRVPNSMTRKKIAFWIKMLLIEIRL